MSGCRPVVEILPLGPVERTDLEASARTIRVALACACDVLAPTPLAADTYRARRAQYDADALLDKLFDRVDSRRICVVGVTTADLFAEGRSFVFGYAHLRDRVAVFSTRRFRCDDATDEPRVTSRIERAVTHELGHVFGVPHCVAPVCVMRQVEFLWQLDELSASYCAPCAARVAEGVARAPDAPEALFEHAGACMRRRRFGRAVDVYAAAIARRPHEARYHNDHGVALLAIGDRGAAIAAFRRAASLEPEMPQAYYNLGILCRERGDLEAADRFFTEALSRDDDPRSAARYLGVLHQDSFGDHRRARRYFARYLELGGDDPEALRRLRQLGEVAESRPPL